MTTRETDRPQHEQDYETVRSELESLGKSREDCCDPCHYRCVGHAALESLSRLAHAAAKVPGLEAQSTADFIAMADTLRWARDLVPASDYPKPSRHVTALLERLAKAESERDAARQERDEAREAFGGMTESRDTAVLSETKAWAKLREEKAALRERVATLEQSLADEKAQRRDDIGLLGDKQARADTAEARVKELEAQVAGARNAALEEAANLLDNVDSANPASLIRSLASQPPPAPAQGFVAACERLEQRHLAEATDASEPLRTAHRYAAGAAKALGAVARDSKPTPPALVDAVGTLLSLHDATTPLTQREWFGTWGAVRAAYDAAKGGGK